jgi:phage baseplate assembly protein W
MAIIPRRQINSPLDNQPIVYSDFSSDMELHPIKKDVLRHTNENSIKRAIKNLLLTNRGERFFQPNLGSDIRSLLFEPFTPATEFAIQKLITSTIENYEPRAKLLNVHTSPDPDLNTLYVAITFSVINSQEPITLQLTLDRIR